MAIAGVLVAGLVGSQQPGSHWYGPVLLPVLLLAIAAFTITHRKLRPYEESSEAFKARWHREMVEDLEQRKRQRAWRRANW